MANVAARIGLAAAKMGLSPLHRALPMQLLRMLAVVGLSLAAEAACGQAELYTKHDSLQQTIGGHAARFQAWQASRRNAWTPSTSAGGIRLRSKAANGSTGNASRKTASKKVPRASRRNRRGEHVPPTTRSNRSSLLRLPTFSTRPSSPTNRSRLTIELSRHEGFGGFAYRPPPSQAGVRPTDALVWVNGRRLPLCDRMAGYGRVPVAKRRGWHDAVLIDVPLVRGENRLLALARVHSGRGSMPSGWSPIRCPPCGR